MWLLRPRADHNLGRRSGSASPRPNPTVITSDIAVNKSPKLKVLIVWLLHRIVGVT